MFLVDVNRCSCRNVHLYDSFTIIDEQLNWRKCKDVDVVVVVVVVVERSFRVLVSVARDYQLGLMIKLSWSRRATATRRKFVARLWCLNKSMQLIWDEQYQSARVEQISTLALESNEITIILAYVSMYASNVFLLISLVLIESQDFRCLVVIEWWWWWWWR